MNVFKLLLLVVFFNLNNFSYSQEKCNCTSDFSFVVDKIEQEHPGFKWNVNKNSAEKYKKLKDSIYLNLYDKECYKQLCQKNLKKYLSFFRDKHLQIYDPIEIKEKEYNTNFKSKNISKFSVLDTATVLVSVPSFNYKLYKELDSFYDSISPLIKQRKHVIIDLRNNGGGGERMYKQLYNIVNKNLKRKRLH